ncbi:hypothetical protein [Sphaerisporangium album]|uniref:hypothetical protein n=1 Tax=Sphaerisporangium album TaxID=509200 RepID=UPI001FEC9BEF|nr:hypothetical protein [Sphaerisporangium album]
MRRLVATGRSNAELAAHFGVTESGILQAKRTAGLAKPMLDHGRALPWKLNRVHNQTGPATNLRNLSAIAQGAHVPQAKVNTALRWARRLAESGLDVGYSYEDGFYERPVEGTSHIEAVLNEALRALGESGSGTTTKPSDAQ